MEFLFEFIFELIFEGSIELGSSRSVPVPVRIIALAVFLLISLGITALFVVITVVFIMHKQYFLSLLLGALAVFFIRFIVKKILSFLKTNS